MRVFCSYEIRNWKTAYEIRSLVDISGEDEVIIFPFAAFPVTRVKQISSDIMKIDLKEWVTEDLCENKEKEDLYSSC
jgi:hypothetical protein